MTATDSELRRLVGIPNRDFERLIHLIVFPCIDELVAVSNVANENRILGDEETF